jgi:hypothetical protein
MRGVPSHKTGVVTRGRKGGKRGRHSRFGGRGGESGNGKKQIANQAIQFDVVDQVHRLLTEQRASENPRQAEHRLASAGVAIGSVVFADEFTLGAKNGRPQR